ncbi:tocopherol O-methyltransferase [Fistulifera solaris]|uniref:Tocopherol O-methyltransferase n=1 Tax=Fistulifera solaris TaxID=1519565 RepID=A0A1Z5JV60_FISSO|nr:tocopherol O-methyltransferase [Fistulifera solaris]|eukprot:GAX17746.1 tocopherol O-methyltransferase [Fistulifera solaris]
MFKATLTIAWITCVTQAWIVPRPQNRHSTQLQVAAKIGRGVQRVKDSLTSAERSREDLKIGIAGFYDRSTKLWEEVWGDHLHHGYYVPADRTDHKQAQIDMIDEVLKWAGVDQATRVVDVGCGIGGSSRHIARKFPGCQTEGITLSPYQAGRGNELAAEQGLADQCRFQVADALDMPFADDSFDLIWSLESGEHMPDKKQFINELFRVCEPGGRIIVVTWCHRDLEPGETSLTKSEEKLLRKINRAYYLPQWCSVKDYVDLMEAQGATDVKRDDWSYIIAPFWKAVIKSSLNLKSVIGLLRSGFSTQRGAYAMFLMLRGYKKGLIKFGCLTCTKPLSKKTEKTESPSVDKDSEVL